MSDVWVFGYGSLMWDPGFPHADAAPALIRGWHRAFSIVSHESWGSAERPGLVAALHAGGACRGLALRVRGRDRADALDYLDRRENAYRRIGATVELTAGRRRTTVSAVTYVFDAAHERAVGKLPLARTARLIAQGEGRKGSARGYLLNTVGCLTDMGSRPGRPLRELVDAVNAHASGIGTDASTPPV